MNAARTGHRHTHDRRRAALRRRSEGWRAAYPCDHCDVGTVWARSYDKGHIAGTEHRCDYLHCPIFRRVK
jgi:hypothetical protein